MSYGVSLSVKIFDKNIRIDKDIRQLHLHLAMTSRAITVTETVSVAFRNVSYVSIINLYIYENHSLACLSGGFSYPGVVLIYINN